MVASKRREATPEQKLKAQERRERFKALVQRIALMSEEEREAIVMRAGAVLTCEAHPLSPGNTLLVIMQRPNASMVGGFQQWLRQGRCVRKGESGLSIWVPTAGKKPAVTEEGASPEEKRGFILGTVFDISQTDAKDNEPSPGYATAACAASGQ